MTNKTIAGIDPGQSGGIAILAPNGVVAFRMPETYADIYDTLAKIVADYDNVVAYLEDVGCGIPGQSSKATATFARHNGHLEMALYALGVPTTKVTPAKWMKFYSNTIGTSKGLDKNAWKNKLKGEAQRRFPQTKPTLYTADALLIAEWGKHQEL